MKFSVEKTDLLASLAVVSKAISAKTPSQILQSIKLTAKNGALELYGTDTEVFIKDICLAHVLADGSLIVGAKNLTDIIRAFPTEEIFFDKDEEGDTLKIYGPGCEFTLMTKPLEEYPHEEDTDPTSLLTVNSEDLKTMIQKTVFACANTSSNIALTGLLVEVGDNELRMVGVDGFKLARRVMPISYTGEVKSAVVPQRIMNEIAKILPSQGSVSFGVEGKKFIVKTGSTVIVSNLLNCKFINFAPIMEKEYLIRAKVSKAQIMHACERALLLSQGNLSNVLILDMKEEKIYCSSRSSIGELKEEIALKELTAPIRIVFNPRYLLDIIKAADEEIITIHLINNLSQIAIKDEEEHYTYILTPIRQ